MPALIVATLNGPWSYAAAQEAPLAAPSVEPPSLLDTDGIPVSSRAAVLPRWLPVMLLSLGVVLLIFVVFTMRQGRPASPSQTARGAALARLARWSEFLSGPGFGAAAASPQRSDTAQNSQIQGSLERLIEQANRAMQRLSELSTQTQEIAGSLAMDLDEKAAKLENLIQRADERLDRLAVLSSRAAVPSPSPEGAGSEHVQIVTRPVTNVVTTLQAAGSLSAARSNLIARSLDAVEGESQTGSNKLGSNEPGTDKPGSSKSASEGPSLASRISVLDAQGCSALEIARQTGQPIGKVELILALKNIV